MFMIAFTETGIVFWPNQQVLYYMIGGMFMIACTKSGIALRANQ